MTDTDRLVEAMARAKARFVKGFVAGEPDACWLWLRSKSTNNRGFQYGTFGMTLPGGGKRTWRAHRAAWFFQNGDIPEGLIVRHKCDTPLCVNPKHLLVGTKKDNTRDMLERNRQPAMRGSTNPFSKLTEADVRKIRELLRNGRSQSSVAREFGVSFFPIHQIAHGRLWTHVREEGADDE